MARQQQQRHFGTLTFPRRGFVRCQQGVWPENLLSGSILPGDLTASLDTGRRHGDRTYLVSVLATLSSILCTHIPIDAHSLPLCRSQTASNTRRRRDWSAGCCFSKEGRHRWNFPAIRPPLRLDGDFYVLAPLGAQTADRGEVVCHVSWQG
jgi:hypothetical protein